MMRGFITARRMLLRNFRRIYWCDAMKHKGPSTSTGLCVCVYLARLRPGNFPPMRVICRSSHFEHTNRLAGSLGKLLQVPGVGRSLPGNGVILVGHLRDTLHVLGDVLTGATLLLERI